MPAGHNFATKRCHDAEIRADAAIHVGGSLIGVVGASVIIAMATAPNASKVLGSLITYSAGLVAMLSFSAAYHLERRPVRRELLRRFDHAAIFVMISGTYTPFTACVLSGRQAIWVTAAMWFAALVGAGTKLAAPRRFERLSVAIYLFMGWSVLILVHPLLDLLDHSTSLLLLSGGVTYSIGACIHRWDRLPFHDAIWHGLVVIAAALHYVAIWRAVLPP